VRKKDGSARNSWWWNEELMNARRNVRRMRGRYQNEG